MNTVILSIQRVGNRLQARRSLNTNLRFQSYTLRPLRSRSKNILSKLTSRAAAVEMVVDLEEGRLSSQIWFVISVSRMAISRKIAGQREMALVGTHPRSQQISFQDGLLRSLLFQIQIILQQPPWPTTTISKSGTTIAIMVMVHGGFTGRVATMNGEIIKARSHLFPFPILIPMQ